MFDIFFALSWFELYHQTRQGCYNFSLSEQNDFEDGDCFNSFIYDPKEESIDFYKHIYSKHKDIFEFVEGGSKQNIIKESIFQPQFLSMICEDSKGIAESFEDYFVFPRINNHMYKDNKALNKSFEDFENNINEYDIISIYGISEMGKTTILKKLFLEFCKKEKYVLFISIQETSINNMKRVINNAITDQYLSDKYSFEDLKQNHPMSIILIDNFHMIKESQTEEFLKFLKSIFGKIIFTTAKDMGDFSLKEIQRTYQTYNLKILPFTGDDRKELIRRILNLDQIKKLESIFNLTSAIDNIFSKNINMFNYRTGFIVEYIIFYSNNSALATEKIKKYDEVFQSNLVRRITEMGGVKHNNTTEILQVLTSLALKIHEQREYPFSETLMIEAVTSHIKKFDYDIKVTDMIKYFEKSRLIIRHGENYKFDSQLSLAFFVARGIFANYDDMGNYEQIREVLSTLCFGINGDVLLFLVMFSKNPRLLFKLIDEANEFTNEWNEFTFLDYRKTLFQKLSALNIRLYSSEERKEISEKKHERELEVIENSELHIESIYDYVPDEATSQSNKIIIAKKYLDTVAIGFSNFLPFFDVENLEIITKYIFNAPNKILGELLNTIDENYQLISEDLIEIITDKEDVDVDEAKEKAHYFLTDLVTGVIPALLNDISDIVVDRKSSTKLLKAFSHEAFDYQLRKLLIYVTLNDIEQVIDLKNRIINENINKTEEIILKKVIKKFMFSFPKISMQNIQRLTAHLFPEDKATQFLYDVKMKR